MDSRNQPLYLQVAQRLIEQLKAGTSPWQKPWNGNGIPAFSMPYNQQTLKRYKGINAINLLLSAREDPRWMTFRQAELAGYRVNRNEKGTLIQFVKTQERCPVLDDRGSPVLDGEGNPLLESRPLSRAIVSNAWVFNASQISGIPPLVEQPGRKIDWDPIERAEELIRHSGARINHQFIDQAYYHISFDLITLPDRSQFSSPAGYYATLLHELAHWTGHPSRLDRESLMKNGIEAYAREELRAEIASMLLGDELHIGHDPSQHAAYVESWVSILENNPVEIHSAAMDAEKIFSFLIGIELELKRKLEQQTRHAALPGEDRSFNIRYLTTGDEIGYKGNIYQIQGHLKQGRLRVVQLPSGLHFTLSMDDGLYQSLLKVKSAQKNAVDFSAAPPIPLRPDVTVNKEKNRR